MVVFCGFSILICKINKLHLTAMGLPPTKLQATAVVTRSAIREYRLFCRWSRCFRN